MTKKRLRGNVIRQVSVCLAFASLCLFATTKCQAQTPQKLLAVSIPNNAGEKLSETDENRVSETVLDIKHWLEIDHQRQRQTLNHIRSSPGILDDEAILVAMGPKIIPVLLGYLDNSEAASYLGEVLGLFGKPSAVAIVNMVKDHSLTIKMRNENSVTSIEPGMTGMAINSAANTLAFVGLPALPELARLFNQNDAKVGALWTTRNIIWNNATVRPVKPCECDPVVIDGLKKALKDRSQVVIDLASSALERAKATTK